MDPSLLLPELRPAIAKVPRAPISRPLVRRLARTVIRHLPARGLPAAVRREKIWFRRGVGVRVYTPHGAGSGAGLLWIHGGGMVIGAAAQDDLTCALVAEDLGITVVSVEYRLAPEHPYPQPLDDCVEAWHWFHGIAHDRGIDPGRVAVGGQSAGGGLAAGLVQRLHDAGGTQPVAQWLFCPMLDDRTAARDDLDAVGHFVWDNAANRVGWSAYLGDAPGGSGVAAYASPARRQDLTGLPPAWIGTGDLELFYEEDVAYALALQEAGVPCTVDPVAGAPHAFESLARRTAVATAYRARAHAWLGLHLGSVT